MLAFLMLLPTAAVATDLLARPVISTKPKPSRATPARRIALGISALAPIWSEEPRETYGTIPGLWLSISRALTEMDWVEFGLGYAHRSANSDREPTFLRADAGSITLVPASLGLRIRGPLLRPVGWVLGLDLTAMWAQERLPRSAEPFHRSSRHSGWALGRRVLIGPELTLPWRGLVAGCDLTWEGLMYAREDSYPWIGAYTGFSGRLSIARRF